MSWYYAQGTKAGMYCGTLYIHTCSNSISECMNDIQGLKGQFVLFRLYVCVYRNHLENWRRISTNLHGKEREKKRQSHQQIHSLISQSSQTELYTPHIISLNNIIMIDHDTTVQRFGVGKIF